MALNTSHPVTKQNISRLPTDYEIASYKLCQFRGSFSSCYHLFDRRCRSDGSRRCSGVTLTIQLSTKKITNTFANSFKIQLYFIREKQLTTNNNQSRCERVCVVFMSFVISLSPRNNCLNKYRRFPSYKYIIGHNVLSKLGGTP